MDLAQSAAEAPRLAPPRMPWRRPLDGEGGQDSGKVEVEHLHVQGLVALEESCVCFLQRKSRG